MALAKGHRRGVLGRGWRAGGAGGKLDVVGRCHFGGGREPDHFEYGRYACRGADFEKLQRPGVAEEAAMIGGVVRFPLRNQGGELRDTRHAQQEHDQQCFPVAVDVGHYGNGLTVYKRRPQQLGYQSPAASGRPDLIGQALPTVQTTVLVGTVPTEYGILSDGVSIFKHLSAAFRLPLSAVVWEL